MADYNYKNEEPELIRDTNMDSFIEIELYQDNAYVAGTPIYGTVHLYCKDNITDVKQITLTLTGEEQVILHLPDKSAGGVTKPVIKIHPIVNENFTLFDYSGYENVIL